MSTLPTFYKILPKFTITIHNNNYNNYRVVHLSARSTSARSRSAQFKFLAMQFQRKHIIHTMYLYNISKYSILYSYVNTVVNIVRKYSRYISKYSKYTLIWCI